MKCITGLMIEALVLLLIYWVATIILEDWLIVRDTMRNYAR